MRLRNAGSAPPVIISNAYKTVLWTGDGTSGRQISAVDLSGGGAIIIRRRNAADAPRLYASANGSIVYGAQTSSLGTYSAPPITFTASGFTLSDATHNVAAATYVAWVFKKTPRFVDVVTYTGDGALTKTMAHANTVEPAVILVTRIDGTNNSGGVRQYRRSSGASQSGDTGSSGSAPSPNWGSTAPTASTFTVGKQLSETHVNDTSVPYMAVLFAHDPVADGAIQECTWTGNASTSGPTVPLSFQMQALFLTYGVPWRCADNVRTPSFTGSEARAYIGTGSTEDSGWSNAIASVNSSGFTIGSASLEINGSGLSYAGLAIKQ